jgi:serine protease AprX
MWSSGAGKAWLRKNSLGSDRVIGYDAIANRTGDASKVEDKFGHGTHLASVVASSRRALDGTRGVFSNGIAPGVSLLVVRAFDDSGRGSYADVIRGIEWVVEKRDAYNVRVLNLSFSAPPQSNYWDDPLNQAVMAAWQAGITVVASAGNEGPSPMSVGVPGNVPYVITVGAVTDNRTPFDRTDDRLASFSSAGPTREAFVKPEVVAPGGHVLGLMNKETRIAREHPNFHDGEAYYFMSGTSQSAAVSGAAALILQNEPEFRRRVRPRN